MWWCMSLDAHYAFNQAYLDRICSEMGIGPFTF